MTMTMPQMNPAVLAHLQQLPMAAQLLGLHHVNNVQRRDFQRDNALVQAQAFSIAFNEVEESNRPMNWFVLGDPDPTTVHAKNDKPTYTIQVPKAWTFGGFSYRSTDTANFQIISLNVGSLNMAETGTPPAPLSILANDRDHKDRFAAAICAETTDLVTFSVQLWCLTDNSTFGGIVVEGVDGGRICALEPVTQNQSVLSGNIRKASIGFMELVQKTFNLAPIIWGNRPPVAR